MSTVFSKLSVKSQTVIPLEIRTRLGLKPGDRLRYRVTRHGVTIDKADAQDDPLAAFTEWETEADGRAYASL